MAQVLHVPAPFPGQGQGGRGEGSALEVLNGENDYDSVGEGQPSCEDGDSHVRLCEAGKP